MRRMITTKQLEILELLDYDKVHDNLEFNTRRIKVISPINTNDYLTLTYHSILGDDYLTILSEKLYLGDWEGDYNNINITVDNEEENITLNGDTIINGKVNLKVEDNGFSGVLQVKANGVNNCIHILPQDGETTIGLGADGGDTSNPICLINSEDGYVYVSLFKVTEIEGINGYFIISNLPTSDPQLEGAVWNDNGVLKISAGA